MGSLLRLAAVTAAAFVALGFVLFAADRSREQSANQSWTIDGARGPAASDARIDRPAPDPESERLREGRNSGPREVVDDVNDMLLAPFGGTVRSSGVWVERIVSGALGLLLYGLGGMLLANFRPKRRRRRVDWREPAAQR